MLWAAGRAEPYLSNRDVRGENGKSRSRQTRARVISGLRGLNTKRLVHRISSAHRAEGSSSERIAPRKLPRRAYCADQILQQQGITCTPTYWSERDDWTLAMVAAGLGFSVPQQNLWVSWGSGNSPSL
jgi:hypothetical protein